MLMEKTMRGCLWETRLSVPGRLYRNETGKKRGPDTHHLHRHTAPGKFEKRASLCVCAARSDTRASDSHGRLEGAKLCTQDEAVPSLCCVYLPTYLPFAVLPQLDQPPDSFRCSAAVFMATRRRRPAVRAKKTMRNDSGEKTEPAPETVSTESRRVVHSPGCS